MRKITYTFILVNLILFLNSCDTGDSLRPNINLDCNGVENGLAVLDSCRTCQLAYIYNYVTHETQFINDTLNLELGVNEMLVLPNNPMNPYWNANCNTFIEENLIPNKPQSIINIMGQVVRFDNSGFKIHLHKDGRFEKKYIVE